MIRRARVLTAVACAAGLIGCAAAPSGPRVAAPSPPTTLVAAERATQAAVAGTSTKADVAAALGETLALRFHSGFEVWVYRLAGGTADAAAQRAPAKPAARGKSAEFVILFSPSGVVAKTRIRPASG